MPQGGSASTLAANSLNSRSAQNWQSPSQTGSQPTTQSAGAKSAGGPQFSGQIGAQGSVAGGGGLGSAGGSSTGSDTSTPQASFSGGRIVGQSQGVQSQTAGASSIRKSSANRKLASASDANSYTRSVLSLLRDDPDSALNSLHSGKLDESLNKGMVRVFDDSNQPHGPKGALCIEQWNPNNKSFKLMTPDNPQCSP